MIGRTLSHYKILEKLGEGGMGEVFLAEDLELGRQIALKVLPPDMAADPERLERFRREARTVAALNHPNIVTLHSVEGAGGLQFFTMELIEGRSLDHSIPPDGLPLQEFLNLALQLVEALCVAHDQGITHRDLKPGNVMVTNDNRLKVLDFGLAKIRQASSLLDGDLDLETESITLEGTITGTVPYMSPEQARGKPIDTRSDIFSLGVMLYEMATGKRPFTGDNALTVLASIVKDTPVSVVEHRPELPEILGRMIHRCLAKEPQRRYQSVLDVRNELDEMQREDNATESREISGSSSKASNSQIHSLSRWWPLGVTAVLLATLLLGRLMIDFQPSNPPTARPPTAVPGQGVQAGKARIVVLPFKNLGAGEDAFFAAGVSEEIRNRLASLPRLLVISRNSAVRYASGESSIHEIGSALKVGFVLEGTVRWSTSGQRDRVRITPQLVRVSDDTQIWSEVYDRVLEDIFAVQSDIASKVSEQMGLTLVELERTAFESRTTSNLGAYEAFLRARDLESLQIASRGGSADPATRLYNQALERDPEFTEAWVSLVRHHLSQYHNGSDRSASRLELARVALGRAQELDRDAANVRLAEAYFEFWGLGEHSRALRLFASLSGSYPNDPDLWAALASLQHLMGQISDAERSLERALELDPHNSNLTETLRTNRESRVEGEL